MFVFAQWTVLIIGFVVSFIRGADRGAVVHKLGPPVGFHVICDLPDRRWDAVLG